MERHITIPEKILLVLLTAILVFMIVHDWIPLGSLNELEGIRAENTIGELLFTTLFNTISIGIVLFLAYWFRGRIYPLWVKAWLIIHPCFIFAGALKAWWIPYFTGADDAALKRYETMFADTHHFLPEINGFSVNTIHAVFHATLLTCIFLIVFIVVSQLMKQYKTRTSGKAL